MKICQVIGQYSDLNEKDENLKEKFKQALISTIKAISEDFANKTNLMRRIIVQKIIIFLS